MSFTSEFKHAMVKQAFIEDDGAGLHDAIFEATNRSLSPDELKIVFYNLPPELQLLALQWSMSDTQFRDDVYNCLMQGKIVDILRTPS